MHATSKISRRSVFSNQWSIREWWPSLFYGCHKCYSNVQTNLLEQNIVPILCTFCGFIQEGQTNLVWGIIALSFDLMYRNKLQYNCVELRKGITTLFHCLYF